MNYRVATACPSHCGPKAEALLRQFLAQPGRLFSREELIAALWPATVVTDDSLVQCVGELRTALDDHSQRLIRTVPRRGYRFEVAVAPLSHAPVTGAALPVPEPAAQALAPAQPESAQSGASVPRSPWTSGSRALILLGVTTVALIGGAALYFRPTIAPIGIDEAITAGGTVAVMNFVTAPDEPALRGVADAVADEITAQFATRIGMRGIGRAATSAFDAAAPPLARIASTLKAKHVVTGRVARAGGSERMSIDVQLIAVANGEVIWARHYERTEASGAQVATDIGQHIVNAVRNSSGKRQSEREMQPGYLPDAVGLTLMGWRDLDRRKSIEDVRRARSRFQAALRDDPQSVIALNGLGASYSAERADPANRLSNELIAEHERVVDRARALAPEDATALLLWGNMQIMRGRADLALPALEKANRLVPSYPAGHMYLAQALLMLGRIDEVPAKTERAVELGAGTPRFVSSAYAIAAEAALMRGDDERARDLARRGIAALPSNAYAHAALAAADAFAGRTDEAAAALAAFLKLWPNATVAEYDKLRRSTHPAYLAQRERLYEGLRKAGLPER